MDKLNDTPTVKISLVWHADGMPFFSPLLQEGFMLKARVNSSISDVLCGQFGLSPDYLKQRINTIFLDGKPVDDVDSAIIKNESMLALSAAMPGFVGAAFRKGGFYAPMRREITHVHDQTSETASDGWFSLKLYNLVSTEVGTLFLDSGIFLPRESLEYFLDARAERFWSFFVACRVNHREMALEIFRERTWLAGSDLVHLRVVSDDQEEQKRAVTPVS